MSLGGGGVAAGSLGSVLSQRQVWTPTGTSSDGTSLQAALTAAGAQAALSPGGVAEVYVRPGTSTLGNNLITVPNGVVLEMHPNAVLNFARPFDSGNPTYFGLYATEVADASVTSTTLAATPTWGATTISTVGTVAVGKWIKVVNATDSTRVQIFKVLARSGSGPCTLTLDVPVMFDFASGDAVSGTIPAQGVKIQGGQITGTGSIAVQFHGSIGCTVRDLLAPAGGATFDWGVLSFDYGGRNNAYLNCRVSNDTASGGVGIGIEGNVDSSAIGCRVDGAKTYGIYLDHTRNAKVVDFSINGVAGIGLFMATANAGGGLDNTGSIGTQVSSGDITGCTSHGAEVYDGSVATFTSVQFRANGGHGVLASIGSVSSTMPTVTFSGCEARDNLQSGFHLQQATRAKLIGCSASGNGSGDTNNYADLACNSTPLDVDGFSSVNAAFAAILITGTTHARMSNLYVQMTASAFRAGVWVTSASVVAAISGLEGVGVSGQNHQLILNGYQGSGGALTVNYARSTNVATGYNGAGFIGTAGTLRKGAGFEIGASGGAISPGQITGTNATPVSVAFGDITANTRIRWRRISGTPSAVDPTVVITAGTGFTAATGDTAVWEYELA